MHNYSQLVPLHKLVGRAEPCLTTNLLHVCLPYVLSQLLLGPIKVLVNFLTEYPSVSKLYFLESLSLYLNIIFCYTVTYQGTCHKNTIKYTGTLLLLFCNHCVNLLNNLSYLNYLFIQKK